MTGKYYPSQKIIESSTLVKSVKSSHKWSILIRFAKSAKTWTILLSVCDEAIFTFEALKWEWFLFWWSPPPQPELIYVVNLFQACVLFSIEKAPNLLLPLFAGW